MDGLSRGSDGWASVDLVGESSRGPRGWAFRGGGSGVGLQEDLVGGSAGGPPGWAFRGVWLVGLSEGSGGWGLQEVIMGRSSGDLKRWTFRGTSRVGLQRLNNYVIFIFSQGLRISVF